MIFLSFKLIFANMIPFFNPKSSNTLQIPSNYRTPQLRTTTTAFSTKGNFLRVSYRPEFYYKGITLLLFAPGFGLNYIYIPHYSYLDMPRGHTFPMKKYLDLYDILCEERIIDNPSSVIVPEPVSYQDLSLVHSLEYLGKFQNGTLSEQDIRRLGVPW